MVNIAYGCCVGSWDKFRRYVEPWTRDRLVFATAGQTSIAKAYNAIFDSAVHYDIDALVLLHDDLEITDPNAEHKFMRALADPYVAIVGVAGGRNVTSLAWWEAETVGHQMIDSGLLDFGPREGEVQSLEGSIMVFSPWAIEHLRFDERITGFHGYDEISFAALARRKRVVVVDVDTHHHTQLGFTSKDSEQAWHEANALFHEKWMTK